MQPIIRVLSPALLLATLTVSSPVCRVAEAQPTVLTTVENHFHDINNLTWSPDGKTLASSSDDLSVKLWTNTGQYLRSLDDNRGRPLASYWSRDSQRLAIATEQMMLRIYRADTGQLQLIINEFKQPIYAVSWSRDGKTLAAASGKEIVLVDVEIGQVIRRFKGGGDYSMSLDWSPDGKTLASGSNDYKVRLWQVATGKLVRSIEVPADWAGVEWGADWKLEVSSAEKGLRKFWNVEGEKLSKPLRSFVRPKPQENPAVPSYWSPDGKLYMESVDNTLKVWEVATGKLIQTLVTKWPAFSGLTWNPDNKTLAAVEGRMVTFWRWAPTPIRIGSVRGSSTGSSIPIYTSGAPSLQPLQTPSVESYPVETLSWSPDGNSLAHETNVTNFRVWNTATNKLIHTLPGGYSYTDNVSWSPDGKIIASGGGQYGVVDAEHSTAKLWDAATGQLLQTLKGHERLVNLLAWSPDSKTVASASKDGSVKLWEPATGQLIRTFEKIGFGGEAMAWSPDGKNLALGCWNANDGTEPASSPATYYCIKIFDVSTGEMLRILKGHEGVITFVAWSRDGKRLATSSFDRSVKVWDAATGEVLQTLTGHSGRISGVAWNPDSNTLASGSDSDSLTQDKFRSKDKNYNRREEDTVKVWNATTGQLLHTFYGHTKGLNTVTWSPDGKTLASSSNDGTIQLHIFSTKNNSLPPITLVTYPLDDGTYVTVGPDGRFDCSASDKSKVGVLHWVRGREVINFSQLVKDYYTPDLIGKVRRGERLKPVPQIGKFQVGVSSDVKSRSVK